jgi:hypothetical protein
MQASLACVAVCGAALTLGATVVGGLGAARSVATGAALAVGNLWALARVVTAMLPTVPPARGRSPSWAPLALLKTLGFFISVWLLLRYEIVSPLAMLVGFAALPMGIAIGALVSDIGAAE